MYTPHTPRPQTGNTSWCWSLHLRYFMGRLACAARMEIMYIPHHSLNVLKLLQWSCLFRPFKTNKTTFKEKIRIVQWIPRHGGISGNEAADAFIPIYRSNCSYRLLLESKSNLPLDLIHGTRPMNLTCPESGWYQHHNQLRFNRSLSYDLYIYMPLCKIPTLASICVNRMTQKFDSIR